MRRFSLACLAVVFSAVPAIAQTPVEAGKPFKALSNHDGSKNVTVYRCYVDGVKVGPDIPVSARVDGVVTCDLPGQPVGIHTVEVAAVNSIGEVKSLPGSAFSGELPTAPSAPHIISVQVVVKVQ